MPELAISVESAAVVPFAAAPAIALRLRTLNSDPVELVHTVVLRCQIQIEVRRRQYSSTEQQRLRDLFGETSRWGQTLNNLLWTNATAVIPRFQGTAVADLQVPCTFDFTVAATKYFGSLTDGEIPLLLMFSGTIFYENSAGALQVGPISWNTETRFRLPVKVWQEMMDSYYPNTAWLCLRRDVFDGLQRFKSERGIPTFEQTIEQMLTEISQEITSQ